MPIPYKDLADSSEDDRIKAIGHEVMVLKKTVGFFVDAEQGDAKALRYIDKLQKRFPGIRVLYRAPFSVANTTLVKVGPPLN